eukprot:UN29422
MLLILRTVKNCLYYWNETLNNYIFILSKRPNINFHTSRSIKKTVNTHLINAKIAHMTMRYRGYLTEIDIVLNKNMTESGLTNIAMAIEDVLNGSTRDKPLLIRQRTLWDLGGLGVGLEELSSDSESIDDPNERPSFTPRFLSRKAKTDRGKIKDVRPTLQESKSQGINVYCIPESVFDKHVKPKLPLEVLAEATIRAIDPQLQ